MVYLHVQQVVTILNNPSSSFGEIPIISSTIDYKYIYIYYIYIIYIYLYININILTDVWLYPCVFYGVSHELSPCFLQNSQVAESQGWKTMS
jgi:hypothetical protein